MRTAVIGLVLVVALVGVGAVAPTVEAGPGSGTECNIVWEPWLATDVGGVDVDKPGVECYY